MLSDVWLCNPMSLPGSSIHGILQVRILEPVAIPFSRGSSEPRAWTWVSCIAGGFVTVWLSFKSCMILFLDWYKSFVRWRYFKYLLLLFKEQNLSILMRPIFFFNDSCFTDQLKISAYNKILVDVFFWKFHSCSFYGLNL